MAEFVLPTEKVKAISQSPSTLLIYSSPKIGKTTAVAMLDDSILFELEPKGADFVDAVKVQCNSYEEISGYCKKILEAGKPYRYGILDTTTTLEEMILPLAAKLYANTEMGKNWERLKNADGTIMKVNNETVLNPQANVLKLPNGAGYQYTREAFFKVINGFKGCFERVILLGHLKEKFLEKDGREVSAKEIDLMGKNKSILCANADAIGILYREGNKTIISFKTDESTICGSRPVHLRNRDIVLLEEVDDKLVQHWDEIYID